MMFWLVLLVLSLGFTSGLPKGPIVNTNYGKVRGLYKQSRYNRTYGYFAGIPFAQPPLGDLRFANPVEAKPWQGILPTTKPGPRCLQRNDVFFSNPSIEGSEDCLYLNVYTPKISTGKLLPVLVNIHGGGFAVESGDDEYYHPLYFMDYDVVLVTFNYRLSVFGFLSTSDDVAPGNFGLKDQTMVLKWVRDNIHYFGGSKDHVTIMGESAGGVSVHLHLVSAPSQGLFSKGISQSGSPLCPWASTTNEEQLKTLEIQAGLVNCSHVLANHSELIECLRKVSAEDIMHSQENFKAFFQFPYTTWLPVSEELTPKNPEPFLTKPYLEYLEKGQFKNAPLLAGVMNDEGAVVAAQLFIPDGSRNALNNSFNKYMSIILGLPNNTTLLGEIFDFYLGGSTVVQMDNPQWIEGFIQMASDRYFLEPVYRGVVLQLKYGLDSLYFYNFGYTGAYTYARYFSGKNATYNKQWGAGHCDDLLYLFYAPLFFPPLTAKSDVNLSEIWLKVVLNFAIFGNPNPEANKILKKVEWDPMTSPLKSNDDLMSLAITGDVESGANFEISKGFIKARVQFWQDLSTRYNF